MQHWSTLESSHDLEKMRAGCGDGIASDGVGNRSERSHEHPLRSRGIPFLDRTDARTETDAVRVDRVVHANGRATGAGPEDPWAARQSLGSGVRQPGSSGDAEDEESHGFS